MPIRLAYFLGLMTVTFLLLVSFYLEHVEKVVPCPLCSLQRLAFCLLGITCLLGMFWDAKFWQRFIINSMMGLSSLTGTLLAARQIWIQHHPLAGTADCSASFSYLLETFPMSEVIKKIIFEGGVECSKRGWEFLHLNMAEWAIIWFALFLLLTFYLFIQEFSLNKQTKYTLR